MSAALASKKQPASGTSDGTSSEEGSSSRTNELSSPAAAQNYSPEVGPSVNPEIVEENNHLECASEVNFSFLQSIIQRLGLNVFVH